MYQNIKHLFVSLLFCYSFSVIAQRAEEDHPLKKKLDSLEILVDLDELDKPIRDIKQRIEDAQQLNESTLIAHAWLIQSTLNLYLSEFETFNKNLKTAHSYFTQSIPKKQLILYHNLNGIKHILDNDHQTAVNNYLEALKYAKQENLEWEQIDINYNIMKAAIRLEDNENGLKAVNEIIRLSKKFDTELRLNLTYFYGATFAIKTKDFTKAEEYLRQSKKLYEKDQKRSLSTASQRSNYLIAYSKLYEAKGDYKKAVSYLREHYEWSLEENAKAKKKLAKNINFQKDLEIQKNELTKLQAENDLDRTLLIFSVIAFFGSLFLIYLQYKHSQSKSKSNALLIEAKKEIEKTYNKNLILLNNLSHELKTPLHSINGLTEILKKNNPGENVKHIELLQEFNKIVFHFIEDAMYKTRDKSSISISVYNENIALKKFILEIVALVKNKTNYAFPIKVHFDENLPKAVYLDKIKVRQVVLYLLSKSLSNTSDQSVVLQVRQIRKNNENSQNSTIEIKITDTTDTYNESSSYRTFNLKDDDEKVYNNEIEFGLILAHKFTKIYHGTLSFNTEAKHSIATLQLNLATSSEIILATIIPEKCNYSPKILLVEDNKINRIITKNIISDAGYSIDEAEDGTIAVNKTKTSFYDIVFMDIMMPGIDGFEASKIIKKHNPNTIIIALSAITTLSQKNILEESGISKFLRKPCIKTDLLSAIEEYSQDEKTIKNNVVV